MATGSAHGSVWSSNLSYDGSVDLLSGSGVSYYLDKNTNNSMDVGDIVFGIVKWNNNVSTGAFADYAVAVYAAEVISGGYNVYSTGSAGFNPRTTFFNLGSTTASKSELASFTGISLSSGGIGVVLSSKDGSVGDPTIQSTTNASTNFKTAGNWAVDFEFGLSKSSDFFNTEMVRTFNQWTLPSTVTLAGSRDSVIEIGDYDNDKLLNEYDNKSGTGVNPGSATTGTYNPGDLVGYLAGAFSVSNIIGSPNDVANNRLDPDFSSLASFGIVNTTTLGQPTTTQAGNGWNISTSVNGAINITMGIPEPSTVLVWSGFAVAACVTAVRRRRLPKS